MRLAALKTSKLEILLLMLVVPPDWKLLGRPESYHIQLPVISSVDSG